LETTRAAKRPLGAGAAPPISFGMSKKNARSAADARDDLCDAALAAAAETPWDAVALADLCKRAGVSLATCEEKGWSKARLAGWLDRRLDQAMLAPVDGVDREQSVRDRLFDVLMGRFDAMEENRAAWASILNGDRREGAMALARAARRARTAAWALEAAGVAGGDLKGASRILGLARVLRLAETAWLRDGGDLSATMAALDKGLREAEDWARQGERFARLFRRRAPAKAAPDDGETAETKNDGAD
jgi:hypothetical protein